MGAKQTVKLQSWATNFPSDGCKVALAPWDCGRLNYAQQGGPGARTLLMVRCEPQNQMPKGAVAIPLVPMSVTLQCHLRTRGSCQGLVPQAPESLHGGSRKASGEEA
jgi:hypothetical protein